MARDVVEQVALSLTQAGMQRSTARVMSALLFAEDDSVPAAQLAEQLEISSGSVSNALKMLTTVGLIERVPRPGSRRDYYQLRDGAWARLMLSQNAVVQTLLEAAEQGIAVAPEGSSASVRLAEMRDFYGFIFQEMPALIERWARERGSDAPTHGAES